MKATDTRILHNLPKNVYLQYIKLFPAAQIEEVKTYTTLILTLLAIIIFSLFAISPTINTIVELKKTLADSEFADESLDTKLAAMQSLQEEYGQLGESLNRIAATIPTNPDAPVLLAKIQTLATDAGLSIVKVEAVQVELTKKDTTTQPSAFIFGITVDGTYAQVLQFLESVPQLDRLVTADSISVTRNPEAAGQVVATIKFKAYFHPEASK